MRNKRRSILTVLSLAASLFLLTTLRTVLSELQAVSVAPSSALRLVTRHAVSFANPLPIAYLDRIARVPSLKAVMPGNWFAGVCQDGSQFFGQWTVDQEKVFEIYPEFSVPEEQKQAFRRQSNAAVAGARLFDLFGWKLGQKITLQGTNFPADLELELVGRFTSLNAPDEASLMFRDDYLDESEIWADVNAVADEFKRPAYSSVLLRAKEPSAVNSLVRRITEDRRLHLQARPEVEYFRELTRATAPVKTLGTFVALIMSIGSCFASMNAMYSSVAYRKREIGTLRVIGFQRHQVLPAFLIESVFLAVAGGALGCVLAVPIHGVSTGTPNFSTFAELAFKFRITTGMLAGGIAFAALVGAFGGVLPALLAARRPIIASLRD